MGILHSINRFLGCQTEDEEGESPIYPYSILHRGQNRYPCNGDSNRLSERLRKMVSFHSLIYKAGKGLLQIFRFIFYLRRPRRTADPVLPVQNPAPSDRDPLLLQALLVSSAGDDSSVGYAPDTAPAACAPFADSYADDQELQSDDTDVLASQQWLEGSDSGNRKQTDPVIISIPDFTYSLAHTSAREEMMDSAVFVEEVAPKNVPDFLEESAGAIVNTAHAFIPEIARGNAPDSVEESRGKKKSSEVKEEEEKVMIKSSVVVDEGRWIKHYSSCHRILLVGEGDFSFSTCLAMAFGSASNIIATSLDSKAFLKKNYQNAPSNINELRIRGGKVMHGIDATEMASHELLGHLTFDRIIFNFPFAGFFKNLSRKSQLKRHRRLVSLFLKNAKEMISEEGEIHISHKTNDFHIEWKLEAVASSHRLRLMEAVNFNRLDYPGYNTKCGFGGDNNFNCNPSKTYKFGLKYY
ncbi:UNVERIFIED_CONTAM: Heavy metal-associated isoprenylated plant protein 41 [Sesamum radiatum]|uniref:Heavy metal-associated isoprenylated plant protein 41 n=1 Tax=Sesamum radiatum TaxID=300843 RepID=A0AAW2T2Y2_SESRA